VVVSQSILRKWSVQWGLAALSQGVKQLECEADHLPPSRTDVGSILLLSSSSARWDGHLVSSTTYVTLWFLNLKVVQMSTVKIHQKYRK
jgi:hypothetical protein